MPTPTILDAVPNFRRVWMLGTPWLVPPLTLNALSDLQAWVAAESWDPWEVPPADSPAEYWALVLAKAENWPPAPWTPLAMEATDRAAFLAEFFWIAAGRPNGIERDTSNAAASALSTREWDALMSAAYAIHPADVAGDRLNSLAREAARQSAIDWPTAVAETLAEHPGLSPLDVGKLTILEWRLLRSQGKPARTEIRPAPGESQGEAIRKRRGVVAAARQRLAEWFTPRPADDSPAAGPAT